MAQRAGEKSWEAAISGGRRWNSSRRPTFDVQPGYLMTAYITGGPASGAEGWRALHSLPSGDRKGVALERDEIEGAQPLQDEGSRLTMYLLIRGLRITRQLFDAFSGDETMRS
jgi:hypothetical protein